MTRQCSHPGCDRDYYAKGFCNPHVRRHNAGKEMDTPLQRPQTVEERFWPKVDKSDGCWVWNASRDPVGYGTFGFRGKTWKAHRVSFVLAHGEIPAGAHILHSCDNPPCVNPAHLRVGTHLENMRDKVLRGRTVNANKTHCKWGHEFTPQNTIRRGGGRRGCRTCANEQRRVRRAKKRAS